MKHLSKKIPELVAHRGYANAYPENSLTGFKAAVDCGCRYLELDIQLTRDKIPVVLHDDNLLRTSMKSVNIFDNDWDQIKIETIGEPERFGNKFENEKVCSLEQFSLWLSGHSDVKVFVEIKEESINHFGNKVVLKKVDDVLQVIKSQCFLISFDAPFLFYAKQKADYPIGYVLHKYDDESHEIAKQMQPEILICNYKKIPDEENSLWQNSWEWFLYEICDRELAIKWLNRGVKYIETMDIKPMLESFSNEI